MFSNNLTFNAEGPMMEGTWVNVNTGDSFTVRDSFFEDNQFMVSTTDGRVLNYEQMQNYVKSDKPIQVNKSFNQNAETLPPEVAGILDGSDYDYMIPEDINIANNKSLGNLADPLSTRTYGPKPSPVRSNNDIIDKALSKRSLPDINIGVDWLNFPEKEIDMLLDLMDVTKPEIIDWYLSQIDVEYTTSLIRGVVTEYLNSQLSVPIEAPKVTDKPTKKTTKVKKTKK